jgi:peptide/nickel transport system permease protein
MRRALEKLTFLLLSFAAASVLSFALLAPYVDRSASSHSDLPLLVNLAPRDARDLTFAAVREVASNGPRAAHGREELARLGGAAVPHVLPYLESLDPAARGRVALALAPVARRMGVAADDDLGTPERAIVFFTRFWQDRSADFRQAVVRRKVQRLAERALPLRKKEVLELDTFGLAELFEALGRVRVTADAERVERLHPVLVHVTRAPISLPPNPTIEQAARVATAWREFEFDHGSDFVTLDGPARLAATVLETRYFRFLASVPRAVAGDDPVGAARVQRVVAAALQSVPLALLGLFLGVALATLASRRLRARPGGKHGMGTVALLVAACPLGGLAVRGTTLGPFGLTLALALGLGALLVLELEGTHARPGQFRRALSRSGSLLPLALAAQLGAEAAANRGLGGVALVALRTNDLDALMWIASILSASGCLGILLPDALARPHEDDAEPDDVMPGPRRPLVIALALATVAGFALAGLLGGLASGSVAALASAAGITLLATAAATLTAAVVAGVLGLLAGGISRTAGALLSRAVEISCGLPQPLIACAAFTFGSVPGAALLGALRGIEVGHLLRLRLTEQREAHDIAPPSLGRAPFSPYLKRVLPAAIGPTAVSLALSASWLATVEGAGAVLGAPTSASLSALAMGTGGVGLLALGLLALLTSALALLARDISPRLTDDETTGAPVVLALKRRIDSVRPAKSEPET